MIAYTALGLFIIGLLNCFKTSVKFDKIICGMTLFILIGVFYWYFSDMHGIGEQIFSFLWNSSPSGDIKIDIISNAYNCEMFFPFLIMSILAVGGNYCFRYEERRSNYNALLIFNLMALLLMITSNNFVQLLSAVFLIDIFAACSAKNMVMCKKFIMTNLLADMIIFMLLALINGRIDSLDIRQVINYKNMGYHIDFIAVFGFTSIMMKLGFFPFQIGVVSLRELRFHRLQNILCLFSPISALILLLKFSSLWSASSYFLMYLDIFCPLTMVWSFIRASSADNLRVKTIYWQTMFFALLLELLRFHGFVWNMMISKLLMADYILLTGIYLLYYHAGRKKLISQMIGLKYQSKSGIFSALTIISFAILSLINNLEMIYNNNNRYYIWTYAVLFLLSFCGVIHQICFTSKISLTANLEVRNKFQHPLFLFITAAASGILFSQFDWKSPVFWGMFMVFVVLTLSGLSSYMQIFYKNKIMQNTDLFEKIYRFIFINLLQNVGRLLWLIIDWKLVEKLVTGTIIGLWQTALRFFRNLQNSFIWRCFFIAVVLFMVFMFVPYFKEIE